MKYHTIIIGAGLGGLVTGATLANKGKSVLVLEQHSIPGGCATVYKRKGVTFEVGLHEMDMGKEYLDMKSHIFKTLKINDSLQCVKIPETFTVKTQTKEYRIPEGIEEAQEALTAYFPEEKKGIQRYFKSMRRLSYAIRRLPQDLPFLSFFFYPLTSFPAVCTEYLGQNTVASKMDSYFKSTAIKHLLNANLVYYHDDPCTLSWFYHSVAQYSYYTSAVFIKGGSQELSNALVESINSAGGTVTLRANVVQILIEGNRAIGVRWKDAKGIEHTEYAENIVANCAIENIYNGGMLPKHFSEPKITQLEHAVSLYTVYIIFKKAFITQYPDNAYSTFICKDEAYAKELSSIKEEYTTLPVEERNFVFVDYSAIDSGLVEEGDERSFAVITGASYMHEWEGLDKEQYTAKKKNLAERLLQRLEEYYPNIQDLVEYYEVSTPKTIKRYTRSPQGTAYGFKQNKYLRGSRAPRKATQIKNLYYTGAFTFPGGGFTGAIISGYITGETIAPSYAKLALRIGGTIVVAVGISVVSHFLK